MTTSAQNVVDRAVARNVANRLSSLTSITSEMLHRINSDAIKLREQLVDANRTFFMKKEAINSGTGASARVLDLATLSVPCFRLLRLELPNGTEIDVVDLRDKEAALAPRGYPQGKTIIEVGSEWSAVSGAVSITVYYVQGIAALTLTGLLSQTVTIDDEYSWLLDNRLGRYLAEKDTGRDPQEIAGLDNEYDAGMKAYISFLTGVGGSQTLRHNLSPANEKQ